MIFRQEVCMIQQPTLQARIIVPFRPCTVWKREFHQEGNRKVRKKPKKIQKNPRTIQNNGLVKSYRN